MTTRLVGLFALLLLVLVASGWWWIASTPGDESVATSETVAVTPRGPGAPDPTGVPSVLRAPDLPGDADIAPDSVASAPSTDVVPLALDGGISAEDRVARLSRDMISARKTTGGDEQRRLVARLLDRFVADVVGAGQTDEVVRLAEWRFHRAVLTSGEERDLLIGDLISEDEARRFDIEVGSGNDWFAARWITVLAGLGAGDVVLANWRSLPADQQAHALLALAWDPLRTGDGLRLDPSEAEGYAAFSRALPLMTGRPVPRAFEPVLLALLDREHEGYRGDRFRDTAAFVLGVMVDRRPDLLNELLRAVRAHPEECQTVLYVLLHAQGRPAREALMSVRRRPGATQQAGSDA
ncbi:MAG: hypothetical protein ACYTCU_03200, partial [Planctomycetota bacterium]